MLYPSHSSASVMTLFRPSNSLKNATWSLEMFAYGPLFILYLSHVNAGFVEKNRHIEIRQSVLSSVGEFIFCKRFTLSIQSNSHRCYWRFFYHLQGDPFVASARISSGVAPVYYFRWRIPWLATRLISERNVRDNLNVPLIFTTELHFNPSAIG